MALVAVFLERADRQRAEELLRHGEAGEQALEIARIAKGQVDAARERALGRAGRPDQQRVFARERGEQARAQHLPAFDQARLEYGEQAGEPLAQRRARTRHQALGPCAAP